MSPTITVGKVLKPQGIRGELKILPLTDDPARFKKLSYVLIDGESRKITSCRTTGEAVFLTLENIPDRNAAELYRDKFVEINREDAIPLENGRHFIVDLLGCKVFECDSDGENYVGTVVDILSNGITDVYEVKNNGKSAMFPIVDDLIIETDVENKKITVSKKRLKEVWTDED